MSGVPRPLGIPPFPGIPASVCAHVCRQKLPGPRARGPSTRYGGVSPPAPPDVVCLAGSRRPANRMRRFSMITKTEDPRIPMAAALDGTEPLTPEQFVEQLRALRQHVPDFGPLPKASAHALRAAARASAEFVQASINYGWHVEADCGRDLDRPRRIDQRARRRRAVECRRGRAGDAARRRRSSQPRAPSPHRAGGAADLQHLPPARPPEGECRPAAARRQHAPREPVRTPPPGGTRPESAGAGFSARDSSREDLVPEAVV